MIKLPRKTEKYIPKNARKQWEGNAMARAIKAIKEDSMPCRKAAKTFKVSRSTLQRLLKHNGDPDQIVKTVLGRKTVLGENLDRQLVEYILTMEAKFYGLTGEILEFGIHVSRPLALPAKMPHDFTIILRKNTTATIFHHKIFNVDETGLSIVSKIPQVIGRKGKRQIVAITSAERGSPVIFIASMSADGQFIPPMLIFTKKNRNDQLMRGAPPASIYAVHPSGWIQQNLFTQWFQHFISFVKPSAEDPVLLVLDGHYSHTRNVDVILLARENNISIISLPPHSTHKLNPLDKSFMGPFKVYYSEEIRNWIKVHQRAISVFDVAELLGKAFLKSQTARIAVNGFQVTGI
ncbi:hypothetical protein NQ314_010923 [Rhamnusium bicolor]|uniref:DDE-1 domain-containing protein n=1 Tax=Rhamnusium bicolor TaxID=1586634 RepID=A0AAV8XNC6_9CUCU|nr:hypothetical protein NQ314_010923 [Rhamnusium bicolor]